MIKLKFIRETTEYELRQCKDYTYILEIVETYYFSLSHMSLEVKFDVTYYTTDRKLCNALACNFFNDLKYVISLPHNVDQ